MPLHFAADKGHAEAVQTLVQLGADIESRAAFRVTPLLAAVGAGRVEALKTLLQLGASVAVHTATGETPLGASVRLGFQEVSQVLRQAHFEQTGEMPAEPPVGGGGTVTAAKPKKQKPNDPCACGSGKKAKKCCAGA
jgi:ankyrin repeat protein